MAREITLTPCKTYASKANVEKAIAKYPQIAENDNLRYFIEQTPEGRFFPVFVGQEAAHAGVHFVFNVIG